MAPRHKNPAAKRQKAEVESEEQEATRVSTLTMFEFLRSLNFQLDKSFYEGKWIPTGLKHKDENGNLVPWNVRATKNLLDRIQKQLPVGSEAYEAWLTFRANYKLSRRSISKEDLMKETIQRKVSLQAATGYYVRVPYMDAWLGINGKIDRDQLLNTHMNIQYLVDRIVITKGFKTE